MRPAADARSWLRPSVATGLFAWAAYTVVVSAIQLSSGVPYAEWFKTADNAWRVGVLSLTAGCVLLLALVALWRWDHLWRDPTPLPRSRALTWAMGAWWAAIAVRLAGLRWNEVPTDLLWAIVASGVLVGIAEETLFRGIFLRALREGGRSEASAAIWTAVCFGLFHLPNVFMGTGWLGTLQVVLAGTGGAVLYAFRRHHGSIWPAMLAHGMWDVSTFLVGSYAASLTVTLASLGLQLMVLSCGVAVLLNLHRHDRATVVCPVPS